MTPELLKAQQAYEEAGKALAEAVQAAFPEGRLVDVTIGKHRITGRILHAGGSWWHEPAQVRIVNVNTGGERNFSATYEPGNPVLRQP